MSAKKKSNKISRRKFLDKAGKGIVGSSILIPSIGNSELKAVSARNEDFIKPNETDSLTMILNGKNVEIKIDPTATLAEVVRDKFQLTGTKIVCNLGQCGGCTLLVDGKAVYSCHMLAHDANHKEVLTIEGLLDGINLHPLQDAFIEKDGLQCGFCTPGQIMSAYALLTNNPKPSKEQILKGMSGNLCRCGAYPKIIDSILYEAEK